MSNIFKNKFIVSAISIIFAVAITIIIHAVMPAGVNEEFLDSVFVKLIGFPIISVLYFILLFSHCTIVMRYFGNDSILPKMQIGLRFGLAFAILYFFGMQEVLVEASPFEEWGFAFVSYQFFMGAGDFIPVLLLCVSIAYLILNNTNASSPVKTLNRSEKIKTVIFITGVFVIERLIGYETGIILSNHNTYPVPCYIWTIVFGIVLGCSYVTLYPVYFKNQNKLSLSFKLAVLTIGANWIIFNSFIGLIFSGYMLQMLLRSSIDTVVLFLASIGINKYLL